MSDVPFQLSTMEVLTLIEALQFVETEPLPEVDKSKAWTIKKQARIARKKLEKQRTDFDGDNIHVMLIAAYFLVTRISDDDEESEIKNSILTACDRIIPMLEAIWGDHPDT